MVGGAGKKDWLGPKNGVRSTVPQYASLYEEAGAKVCRQVLPAAARSMDSNPTGRRTARLFFS